MYYTKGQILNLLDCGEKSFKDFISAFQIKTHLINDELVYLKNDIDNALLNIRKTHESYAQHYYTIKQCKSMGISSFSITHKLKRIEIPKEYRFFEFKRLEFLFDKNQDHFFVKDKLIRFKEAIKMLPFTESHGWKNLRKIFNEHNYIIDYTLDKNNGHLLIDDVLKLRELIIERYHFNKLNFLTLQQCRNLGLKKFDMKSLNKKKPDPIDLVYEFKSVLMLYEKKCVEEFLNKKSLLKSNELICEKDISIELGFRSLSKFREIINEYGITHLPRENSYEKKLYRKAEFKYLKDIIQKRYQNNRKNYYNAKDLKKLGLTDYSISILAFIKPNLIDKVYEFSDAVKLYPKQVVDDYLLEFHKSKVTKQVIDVIPIDSKEFNLNKYVKSDQVKQILGYSINKILPFAHKYNLKLDILSFQRRKGINSHSKETDTYYLKSDLIVIKETIDNIKQQKENTKIHEKNKAKALALETKEAEKARKLHEKEVAKALALEAKEAEKARKLHEKEVAKALALEAKEAEKVRKLHEKEVTKVLALEAKEAEKVCKLHEKVKFKSEGLNIETSKAEATLRKKMKGYKTRISDGENIKVLFLTALEELEYIDVDILQNKTFKSWLDFSTRKLNATSTNGKTLYKKFCRYLSLTKSNYENYFFVKLPMLSTKELNTKFFNTSNRIVSQEEIYTFLKFYSKFNDVKYKFQDLKNPHEAKRQITQRNQDKKEIYSITDYIKLIEFASDISTHKKEIEYWYQTKSTSKIRYRSYQSIWLYLILSLNNMWRNFDILTKVPMITLPARFTTFEAYFKNDLTADEAKIIFAELTSKYKTFKSSKTDKDSHFFCSEELILPLANALIACILYKKQSGQIFVIEQTKEFTLAPIMQDIFFSKFEIPNFKFKSKKMNSTLATYSYEYVKNYTNENPLLVTRLMRPHTDINTTNNYIHLSKENFNQITKNLFEGGYFGYTIDYMYRLITNEKSNLLDIDKKNYIITLFKDANKIKNISSQLLFIEKKYKSLHEYLNRLHKDDIEYQLNLITLKQLPAKEEHWQCILGECLYLNRSCISCPFAIPHFYSLTNCMEQLFLLVNKYKALNNESSNEKTFLSNRIFQYLLYLSDAKKKFGSEFINEFSNGNFNLLLEEISNLTDITNYIKIGRGGS